MAGSQWRPSEISGTAIGVESNIFIQFRGEGRFTGNGGCNRFFGSFVLVGDQIETTPLGTTYKPYPQPVMDREQQFLSALERAVSFTRELVHLRLFDSTRNVVMKLIQTDADCNGD